MKRGQFANKSEITKDLLLKRSFEDPTELTSASYQYKIWLLAIHLVNSQISLLSTTNSSSVPSFSATIAFTLFPILQQTMTPLTLKWTTSTNRIVMWIFEGRWGSLPNSESPPITSNEKKCNIFLGTDGLYLEKNIKACCGK